MSLLLLGILPWKGWAVEKTGVTMTWLKCVAAGDYRWMEISPDGEVEFLRAGPDLKILEVRRGHLPSAATDRLRLLLEAADLPGLRRYYPFTPREGLVVELTYDSVAAGTSRLVNVVAHERARPPALTALLDALGELAEAVPETSDRPVRIVALPVENLTCLGEDAREIDLKNVVLPALRSTLLRATEHEGKSIPVEPKDFVPLASQVFGGARLLRVCSAEKSFAVLLLAGDRP